MSPKCACKCGHEMSSDIFSVIKCRWTIFLHNVIKTLSSSASFVRFRAAVRVRARGVFVTRRGPGTTGCRPPPLLTGLTSIPGRPLTKEPASEADNDRVDTDVTCLRWRRLSAQPKTTWYSKVAPDQIRRKWLQHMTRRHMTLTMVEWWCVQRLSENSRSLKSIAFKIRFPRKCLS